MTIPPDDKDLFDFMPGGRPAAGETASDAPRAVGGERDLDLEERVLDAMRTVYDPEIPVNIVELGLIYELEVLRGGAVYAEMTLTSPACPVAGALPGEVEAAIRGVEGVTDVRVKLVWTPPWTQDRMTEEARLELGLL